MKILFIFFAGMAMGLILAVILRVIHGKSAKNLQKS